MEEYRPDEKQRTRLRKDQRQSKKSTKSSRSSSRRMKPNSRRSSPMLGGNKSCKSGRTSSCKSTGSGSTKTSRRSNRRAKGSSKSSRRSEKSSRSGRNSATLARRTKFWLKLQDATVVRRERANKQHRLAGIMQYAMAGILVISLLGVIALTVIPYVLNPIDNEFYFHIAQIAVEMLLIGTACFVIGTDRQALRDLHTSFLICAGSWNIFMVIGGMSAHLAEVCVHGGYFCFVREVTLNHHLVIMNMSALLGHAIATLLSIASIIYMNNYYRELYEVELAFVALDSALGGRRTRRYRGSKKSTRSKRSSRRSSKKSQKLRHLV